MSPLVGEHHQRYWNLSDTNVAPVHIGRGGYPLWQASVIAPSLFGMLGAWIDTQMDRIKWFYRLFRRIEKLDTERRAVLLQTLDTIEAPTYTLAQVAVRETARTMGFNRPEAWTQLSRALKDSPGRAENTFRHLEACRRLRQASAASGSTLTNPVQHLTTELAYAGFAWKGR
jgi:hypothetical protein